MELDTSVEVELYCSNCDAHLDVLSSSKRRGDWHLTVEPCATCLQAEREAGIEEAMKEPVTP